MHRQQDARQRAGRYATPGEGIAAQAGARVGRYWRVFATGLSFTVFGCGGLLLSIAVFPLLNVCVRCPQRRVVLARGVIGLTFRCFLRLMVLLGVMRYELRGRERLRRAGLLVLANHPTLIDTIFLMAFVPNANCIVNQALWRNPFTRGPLQAAGYLRNRDGPQLLQDCIATLQGGSNLIIFPEGSRTPANGRIAFKRGAANVAVHGLRNITPVIVRCSPPALGKGIKWWNVPASAACFDIEVGADIVIDDVLAPAISPALAARYLTAHLQDHFIDESDHRHATA